MTATALDGLLDVNLTTDLLLCFGRSGSGFWALSLDFLPVHLSEYICQSYLTTVVLVELCSGCFVKGEFS